MRRPEGGRGVLELGEETDFPKGLWKPLDEAGTGAGVLKEQRHLRLSREGTERNWFKICTDVYVDTNIGLFVFFYGICLNTRLPGTS